jgi:hypothetical protein
MHKKIMSLLVLSLCFSCTTAEEKLSTELQAKVLELHDTLMPQTEELIKLKSSLDSLSHGKDSVHVQQLMTALGKADQSMMDWMHQFSLDSLSKLDVGPKVNYLKAQYVALSDLQSKTDSSLHAAKTYLSR